jgi:branched-chain amino acid transport system substrate-binding protein
MMRVLVYAPIVAVSLLGNAAMAEETIKIAFIDPCRAEVPALGELGLKGFLFAAKEVNAKGGIAVHSLPKEARKMQKAVRA